MSSYVFAFQLGDGQTSGLGLDFSASTLQTLYVFVFSEGGSLNRQSEGLDLLW